MNISYIGGRTNDGKNSAIKSVLPLCLKFFQKKHIVLALEANSEASLNIWQLFLNFRPLCGNCFARYVGTKPHIVLGKGYEGWGGIFPGWPQGQISFCVHVGVLGRFYHQIFHFSFSFAWEKIFICLLFLG